MRPASASTAMAEIEPAKRLVGHELPQGAGPYGVSGPRRERWQRVCARQAGLQQKHIARRRYFSVCCWRVALHFYRSYLSCDFASPIDQSQKDVSCGMVIVGKTH